MKMPFLKNIFLKEDISDKDVKPQQRKITLQGDLLTKDKTCFFCFDQGDGVRA